MAVAGIIAVGAFLLSTWNTSPVSWVMVGCGLALYWIFLFLDRADTRKYDQETADWYRELQTLVDAGDLDCDPHIGDFAPEERELILEELRKLAPGHRSLRAAIRKVWPEATVE